MSKQTAVEWLVERIQSDKIFSFEKIIEQAKAMEREQIEDAYWDGGQDVPMTDIRCSEYYQRTYGKEADNANG